MQTFSIARASLAVTDDGRVHVMWYYPKSSEMIYTRSNLQRTVFEEQRSMVANYQEGIDAGGDIAASGAKVAIVEQETLPLSTRGQFLSDLLMILAKILVKRFRSVILI